MSCNELNRGQCVIQPHCEFRNNKCGRRTTTRGPGRKIRVRKSEKLRNGEGYATFNVECDDQKCGNAKTEGDVDKHCVDTGKDSHCCAKRRLCKKGTTNTKFLRQPSKTILKCPKFCGTDDSIDSIICRDRRVKCANKVDQVVNDDTLRDYAKYKTWQETNNIRATKDYIIF
jgi:hypothetical protein